MVKKKSEFWTLRAMSAIALPFVQSQNIMTAIWTVAALTAPVSVALKRKELNYVSFQLQQLKGYHLRHCVESKTGLSVPINVVSFNCHYVQKECVTEENPIDNELYADARAAFVHTIYLLANHVQVVVCLVLNATIGGQKYDGDLHEDTKRQKHSKNRKTEVAVVLEWFHLVLVVGLVLQLTEFDLA